MTMFIYTSNEHDIDTLTANGFPLVMIMQDGKHVFSTKVEKDTAPTFCFDELEECVVDNVLMF